jgi:hypothetical protein
LTTGELKRASEAAETLYQLGRFWDQLTCARIGTLRAVLEAERKDRTPAKVQAEAG